MANRAETQRAKAGATLLDVIRPGWADRINLQVLDLSSCKACVLGQLFGSFDAGAEALFSGRWMNISMESVAVRTGFITPWDEHPTRLTQAWRREIKKRQQHAQTT